MLKRVLLVLCLPTTVLAQPVGPEPAPAPAPVTPTPVAQPQPAPPPVAMPMTPTMTEPTGGPPDSGFQIQGRMSTQLVSNLISPGVMLGYRFGNFVIGGELGVTAGKLESDTTTDSFSLVTLVPMLTFDIWQSTDKRARLNLVGGLGIGQGKLTSNSGGTVSEQKASYVYVLAGIGGDYYLHKNFALGVEAGLDLPALTKVEDNGTDQQLKGSLQSLHGIFRVTFVTGR